MTSLGLKDISQDATKWCWLATTVCIVHHYNKKFYSYTMRTCQSTRAWIGLLQ